MKINLLLLVFTLTFVLVTVAGGSEFQAQQQQHDGEYRALTAVAAQANAAQAAESAQRQAIQRFLRSADAGWNAVADVVRTTDPALDASLGELQHAAGLTPAAREKVQAYAAAVTAWRTARDGARRAAAQGDEAGARRALRAQGVPADVAMLAAGQQLLSRLVDDMAGLGAPDADNGPKPSRTLVMSILAGVIVALGFSALTARTISRPLAEVVGVLEGVSRGDLSGRIDATRKDEIGRMGRALDDTLAVLRGAFDDVQHRATHDPLTGLANRTLLRERMDLVQRSHHAGDHISVLLIDLDGFKQVNDVHGHAVGDELLVEVANRLLAGVRQGDTVARIGGDEFVVVLEGAAPADAHRTAEKLLAAIRAPVELPAATVRPSASIGISNWDGECSIGDLMAESDRAMYAAKREGKGRVVRLTAEPAA